MASELSPSAKHPRFSTPAATEGRETVGCRHSCFPLRDEGASRVSRMNFFFACVRACVRSLLRRGSRVRHGTSHRHCAVPSQGKGQTARRAAGLMRAGGARPVQKSSRRDQPLLRVTAAASCCSATGGGRDRGGIGEEGRDGTAQRTLGQGVWEGIVRVSEEECKH